MSRIALFYLIILLEGYIVLSAELIAIRQSMPFVGSGAETVSIIIAAVLLPLAFGYHLGGSALQRASKNKKVFSIRKTLVNNFGISALFLALGLSYLMVELFFTILNLSGIENRITQTTLYVLLFIVTPCYLLGQTVPLISNYFRKEEMSQAAGRILFVSTAGSFLGAIVTSLVLMPTVGVGMTVIINLLMLAGLAYSLAKQDKFWRLLPVIAATGLVILFNNPHALSLAGIVRDNQYNTIRIHDQGEEGRTLELNRTGGSKFAEDESKLFAYVKYIQNNFIKPLKQFEEKQEVLIIGAGGFVTGFNDHYHNYTFVDIDDDLKEVSETYLLKYELGQNKHFVPEEARSFLVRDKKQYRLIMLDVYTNIHSFPPHLMTVEFYELLKKKLAPDGVLVANIATTASFSEPFSVKFDNTFRHVFGHYTRQVAQDYDPWKQDTRDYQNVLYIYQHRDFSDDLYTDNRNTLAFDRAIDAENMDQYKGKKAKPKEAKPAGNR